MSQLRDKSGEVGSECRVPVQRPHCLCHQMWTLAWSGGEKKSYFQIGNSLRLLGGACTNTEQEDVLINDQCAKKR